MKKSHSPLPTKLRPIFSSICSLPAGGSIAFRSATCSNGNIENWVGKNHPRYNSTLTDEEREKKRTPLHDQCRIWRKEIFEKHNYTCQCCGIRGKTELNAHHLDGWNWAKDKRFDLDNGVTLCRKCHYDFHKLYKCGYNTKEQYNKFIELKRKAS